MTDWYPIATAPPGDGILLLTDGTLWAAGYRGVVDELPEIISGGKVVPNPRAGERREFWVLIGCSAFDPAAEVFGDDGPAFFIPTHWAPGVKAPGPVGQ